MKNNEIIEIDGKKYRVELHDIKVPTYKEALEVVKPVYFARLFKDDIQTCDISDLQGNVPTKKDALSLIAYQKLKVLEAYYNEGEEGVVEVLFDALSDNVFHALNPSGRKGVFNLKDIKTALRFIDEQKELLTQFYQI